MPSYLEQLATSPRLFLDPRDIPVHHLQAAVVLLVAEPQQEAVVEEVLAHLPFHRLHKRRHIMLRPYQNQDSIQLHHNLTHLHNRLTIFNPTPVYHSYLLKTMDFG